MNGWHGNGPDHTTLAGTVNGRVRRGLRKPRPCLKTTVIVGRLEHNQVADRTTGPPVLRLVSYSTVRIGRLVRYGTAVVYLTFSTKRPALVLHRSVMRSATTGRYVVRNERYQYRADGPSSTEDATAPVFFAFSNGMSCSNAVPYYGSTGVIWSTGREKSIRYGIRYTLTDARSLPILFREDPREEYERSLLTRPSVLDVLNAGVVVVPGALPHAANEKVEAISLQTLEAAHVASLDPVPADGGKSGRHKGA